VLPNPDGDAKRIHRSLSWFGQRRPYVQRGERVLYFLAPKCLRRGYKLREREPVPSLKKRENRVLLETLILKAENIFFLFFISTLEDPLPSLL
jgi:hypothetical protein